MRSYITRGARTVARVTKERRRIIRGGRDFGRGKRAKTQQIRLVLKHAVEERLVCEGLRALETAEVLGASNVARGIQNYREKM